MKNIVKRGLFDSIEKGISEISGFLNSWKEKSDRRPEEDPDGGRGMD